MCTSLRMESYMTVTAHIIDKDRKAKSLVKGGKEAHTGEKHGGGGRTRFSLFSLVMTVGRCVPPIKEHSALCLLSLRAGFTREARP